MFCGLSLVIGRVQTRSVWPESTRSAPIAMRKEREKRIKKRTSRHWWLTLMICFQLAGAVLFSYPLLCSPGMHWQTLSDCSGWLMSMVLRWGWWTQRVPSQLSREAKPAVMLPALGHVRDQVTLPPRTVWYGWRSDQRAKAACGQTSAQFLNCEGVETDYNLTTYSDWVRATELPFPQALDTDWIVLYSSELAKSEAQVYKPHFGHK